MKIALFLANAGRHSGGPEVYETELVRALAAIDKVNEYHVHCLDGRGPALVGVVQDNVTFHRLRPAIRPLSMLTSLPLQLWRGRADVLHATFMPPPFSPVDYLYTLVCFSMYRHPEFYPPSIRLRVRALVERGIRAAKFLLCVSDNVRGLFQERFGIPSDRMAVTYMAASSRFRPLPEPEVRSYLEQYGIRDPYLLFSGRWEKRKNILGILEAFAAFKREARSPHKLVLTGKRGWDSGEVLEAVARLSLGSDFIDLGPTPVDELPYLYCGAEALVYASLWEGFGMPIVEAMSCGTPVITSNISSMPEVAGGAALLVDPYRSDEIAGAMQRLCSNSAVRQSYRERGLERSREFSWERTARKSLESYRAVAAFA
jgi:glycosyltransferase involved in cell wall biosynthesis